MPSISHIRFGAAVLYPLTASMSPDAGPERPADRAARRRCVTRGPRATSTRDDMPDHLRDLHRGVHRHDVPVTVPPSIRVPAV